jgi:trans-aconitate methyltransferase
LGIPWQWLKDGYIPVIIELKKALGDLRGKQILDYGCGAGKITRPLKLFYGAEVQGIDPSDTMIQEARKAEPDGRYELLTGDFPWSDDTLDGAMSNWVFVDIGSVEEMDTEARGTVCYAGE